MCSVQWYIFCTPHSSSHKKFTTSTRQSSRGWGKPILRRMWAPLEVQRIVSQVTHPHSHTHFRDSNALDTPHHCWELSPSCTQWLQGRHMHLVVSGKPVRSEDLRASTQGPEASPAFARDPTCSKAQSCCYNRKRTLPCMHAAIWASLLGLFLMSPTISSISG